jgi:hypothetical protein
MPLEQFILFTHRPYVPYMRAILVPARVIGVELDPDQCRCSFDLI